MIVDALAMATGRTLLGNEPVGKLRVWLWNGEDSQDELDRRIAAACAHYGISANDIGGRLFVDTGRVQPIVIAKEDRNQFTLVAAVIESIKAMIQAAKIDVFSADPFVSTHAVSENDNMKIAAVAQQFSQIAVECRCAVQLVHHVRKGDGRELTVDDMRGAGALSNAARVVRMIVQMSADEAEKAGIDPSERFRFFKNVNGKSNLTPRSDRSEWRELHSQKMGNSPKRGSGGQWWLPEERIGVVKSWHWPEPTPVVDVPSELLEAIRARISTGNFRQDAQSGDWAGNVVAEVLHMPLKNKADTKRIVQLLAGWTKPGGPFKVDTRLDPNTRKKKKFIVVAD